jgi:glycosyltransferase involved in cell wall biosynthesis
LRIAQVAPLYESVPPRLYGGTERVVAWLTDELVRQGHDVTLFASADSRTLAVLAPACRESLRLGGGCNDPVAPHLLMIEQVAKRGNEFDVIHFHTGLLHCSVARRLKTPHLTTLHGRLDLPELGPLFDEFTDLPVVSISDAQQAPLRQARWVGTVHHGLPSRELTFHPEMGDYLAFLGRISPEKRVDRAIAIATACGWPLKIAAKVDDADADYFQREIRPMLDHPLVDFVGEIGEAEKNAFLGGAKALLFPIDWPEPFGLVMIEALGCGTPIVAFRGGSVPEVVEHGTTGFVVGSLDEAIEATRRIGEIRREDCRAAFDRRFTAARMASDYVDLYRSLISHTLSNRVA